MGMTMTPEKAIDTITHFCEYITPCDEYGYRIDGELCEAHLMAVRALTIQKWIPVTERLPEKGCEHLCRCIVNDFDDMPFYMVLRYILIDEYPHFQHETKGGMKVTHWMPLPEPPKEERRTDDK